MACPYDGLSTQSSCESDLTLRTAWRCYVIGAGHKRPCVIHVCAVLLTKAESEDAAWDAGVLGFESWLCFLFSLLLVVYTLGGGRWWFK